MDRLSERLEQFRLEHELAMDVVHWNHRDELANRLTHLVGFLLSLIAMLYFWQSTQTLPLGLRICCVTFATTMAIVYLFSTLSHTFRSERWLRRMRAWDQGTIYLLIAGTYSPFIWQGSPNGFRGLIMAAVWIAAGIGFYSKVLSGHRIFGISTVTYVLLGWLPAVPLIPRTPWICFAWMIAGGLCYTAGIAFLLRSDRVRYSHAMWHVMVMAGSACHVYAIILLLERA